MNQEGESEQIKMIIKITNCVIIVLAVHCVCSILVSSCSYFYLKMIEFLDCTKSLDKFLPHNQAHICWESRNVNFPMTLILNECGILLWNEPNKGRRE